MDRLTDMTDILMVIISTVSDCDTDLTVAVCLKCFQRCNMSKSEINNVDIVPDSRAISRVIIITVDTQMWSPTDGHLRYVRHQIIWWTLRIFTDTSRLVGTNWIEVSQ